MSIIIRPAPEVFRRKPCLVLVFGAFRPYEPEQPLAGYDHDLLKNVITTARRYRQSLAFSRPIDSDDSAGRGAWLPECRPRISDRVFGHRGASCFSNPDFRLLYEVFASRQVQVAGPQYDSALAATISDIKADPDYFRIIAANPPLHNCSALSANAAVNEAILPHCSITPHIDYFLWLNELRELEYS